MRRLPGPVGIISLVLVVSGVALFALNIFMGGELNVALPLVFLMLGGLFILLAAAGRAVIAWAPVLYLPGAILLSMGLIFLLNVLTGDWNAWAYAWMLIVASAGAGLVVAANALRWPHPVPLLGWVSALGGLTLFVLFGAIAGGLLIQVIAPLLLILGGAAVYILRPDRLLARVAAEETPQKADLPAAPPSSSPALIEPLSARELEVLRLVDQGLSNQEVAQRLNVATSTVKTHINNIYGKLGVQTRVQAVQKARELRLLGASTLNPPLNPPFD